MTASAFTGRLGWYARRLRSMSAPEILHRCHEAAKRRIDSRRDFSDHPWLDTTPSGLPALAPVATPANVPPAEPSPTDRLRLRYEEIRSGRFTALGTTWPGDRSPGRWHLDPRSGKAWPRDLFCHRVPYRHSTAWGDVKLVWELNRLQFLQEIALLGRLTGDSGVRDFCMAELRDWIAANPPFRGVSWASGIELGCRVVSILVVTSLLGDDIASEDLRRDVWRCLAAHGYWLHRYPSKFSSANNHRIAELSGLFLLGESCSALPGAARWKSQGRAGLIDEADKQILRDGVGAEQSPTYTAFTLEWYALCAAVADQGGAPFPDATLKRLRLGAETLLAFADSAGNIPPIGDDDEGRVLSAGQEDASAYVRSVAGMLLALTPAAGTPVLPDRAGAALAGRLTGAAPSPPPRKHGVSHYPDGGYSVIRWAPGPGDGEALLVFDHGPLGFLSIAGHGHADALALWLHLDGVPIFIDAGTFRYYDSGGWRGHFRSTAAHNTLSVGGADSSQIAGRFNWSRKAETRVVHLRGELDSWVVEAEHDGFTRRGAGRHRRRVERTSDSAFQITDRLMDGAEPAPVEIGFLLNPTLNPVIDAEARTWSIEIPGRDRLVTVACEGNLDMLMEAGTDSPQRGWASAAYGRKTPTPRLVAKGTMGAGDTCRFTISFGAR